MSRLLAWSHWQMVCQRLASPPAGGAPARPGPVSADALALAVWMCQWLGSWVQALALARAQSARLGFTPGRRAQLAQEQAIRPFAPGELFGCSLAQAERALTQEIVRLLRLLEAPLMHFPAWGGRTRLESAHWTIVICLARLGQVVRQVAQTHGLTQAQRLSEAALRVAQGPLPFN